MGDGLLGATDLRGRIRRHPFLAAGLAACLGFVGGPFVLGGARRLLSAASRIPSSGARLSNSLPGVVLASLRAVR